MISTLNLIDNLLITNKEIFNQENDFVSISLTTPKR